MTQAEYAISRLTAWLRDYGEAKNPEFVSDVKAVLTEIKRLRETSDELVYSIDELENTLFGPSDGLRGWRDAKAEWWQRCVKAVDAAEKARQS